jgi:hypothetical protein
MKLWPLILSTPAQELHNLLPRAHKPLRSSSVTVSGQRQTDLLLLNGKVDNGTQAWTNNQEGASGFTSSRSGRTSRREDEEEEGECRDQQASSGGWSETVEAYGPALAWTCSKSRRQGGGYADWRS